MLTNRRSHAKASSFIKKTALKTTIFPNIEDNKIRRKGKRSKRSGVKKLPIRRENVMVNGMSVNARTDPLDK